MSGIRWRKHQDREEWAARLGDAEAGIVGQWDGYAVACKVPGQRPRWRTCDTLAQAKEYGEYLIVMMQNEAADHA